MGFRCNLCFVICSKHHVIGNIEKNSLKNMKDSKFCVHSRRGEVSGKLSLMRSSKKKSREKI